MRGTRNGSRLYTERRSPWVYFSETLHAATWGAELAKGKGLRPNLRWNRLGAFMDDPNLTVQEVSR